LRAIARNEFKSTTEREKSVNIAKLGRFISTFVLVLVASGSVQASVVFQETFSTDGSLAGNAVETGSGTWIGHANLLVSGGVARPAADGPGKNALLAFTPESGKIYTLSADVSANSGSWVSLGFVADTAATIYGNEYFFNYVDSEAPWMLVQANESVGTFSGPGTAGDQYFAGVGSSGNMSVVLDTRATNWKATYYFNGSALRTNVFYGTLNITHVGFGGYPTSDLEVDNFVLEEDDDGVVLRGTVFNETFSEDGSIAGRSVETGYGTWIAHSELQATNGVALPAATGPGKNALLLFTPQTGTVYTLSADLSATSGGWLALGFVSDTAATIYGNEFFYTYADTAAPWMYIQPSGNVATFSGPGTGGEESFPGTGSSGTCSITLDTTGSDWKAVYYFNDVALSTNVFSGALNITHVGFGGYPTSDHEVDNFKLEFPYEAASLTAATLQIAMSNHLVVVSSSDLAADYLHTLQVSTDLADGSWSNITPSVSNTVTHSWELDAEQTGFFQILSE
jgi:hypothetical protein